MTHFDFAVLISASNGPNSMPLCKNLLARFEHVEFAIICIVFVLSFTGPLLA